MYAKKEYNKNFIIILLSLLTFGLFCCYYLFVPIVYLSMFIYIIVLYKKEKNINKKDMIKFIVITLVIPFILGFIHFILGRFINISNIKEATTSQGSNYKNLISNFILIIPFILHGYSILRKNKKNIVSIIFIITITIVFVCFCLMFFKFMSSYYFYKFYYILWLLSWYLVYFSLISLLKNHKSITYGLVITYISLFLLMFTEIDYKLMVQINDLGDISSYKDLLNIYDNSYYDFNNDGNVILDSNEMRGVEYFINNKEKMINEDNEIALIGSYWEKRWFESLTDTIPQLNYNGSVLDYYINIEFNDWENDDSKYLIVLNYESAKDEIDGYQKYNIIYENESILILEK